MFFNTLEVMILFITLIKRPFNHGPGHFRKAGQKSMILNKKPWNFIIRIGYNFSTVRKYAHGQPTLVFGCSHVYAATALFGQLLKTRGNQLGRNRVQFQFDTQRQSNGIPGFVIGGGANAATRKYNITRRETAFVFLHKRIKVIWQKTGP